MRRPFLSPATSTDRVKRVPTRNGYWEGVVAAGKKNGNVVVLCADLSESTRSDMFRDAFPDRFIQLGVSEQSMAAIAGGLALEGKIPFIASYATFSPGRNLEQIRMCAAIQNMPMKIVGCHAGVSVGPDGATHQALEDIAIMRVLPNMTVLSPCDALEARRAVEASIEIDGPVYIRLAREATPVFTTLKTPFEVGRAEVFRDGNDVAIIATGPLVYEALVAARALEKDGIDALVMNVHTIKPLDEEAVVAVAKKCGAVVTVEEAQQAGGLGGAVAECLARHAPTPMAFVGMDDRFGTSGKPSELLRAFSLDRAAIVRATKVLLR